MEVNYDSAKKILYVSLEGFVSSEAAKKVLNNYKDIISIVNVRETSLLIDCTNIGVFQQDAITSLEKLYKLYMDTGFKNIVLIKSQNPIQSMQLSKAAKNVSGFTGVFVDNKAEALIACS